MSEVLVGHGDPAQQLTARCEHQRHLKDSGVDPALHVMQQHSATSARFIQALAQLARYKMDVACADEEMGRKICAAVETRRATLDVGYAALELRHPLLTQAEDGEADSEGLLRRLADEEQAARARVATAEGAMPTLDELPRLHEDAWREHALARDQARQEQVHFAELRLEGLRARQRCLERALSGVREGAIELPELPTGGRIQSSLVSNADDDRASPLLAACADLAACVHELGQACGGEARVQAAAIAARIAEEHRGRRRMLQAALQAGAAELRAARHAIEAPAALHGRRARAEALLATLETLQAEVKVAKKEERDAKRVLEDLEDEDEAAPDDPAVERARAKHQQSNDRLAALSRRRDGVVAEVAALSAMPVPAQGQVIGDDAAVPLDFPELPVRAQRIVQPPSKSYEQMTPIEKATYDTTMLLQRTGLLSINRSMDDYDEEGRPDVMVRATSSGRSAVKGRRLRGAVHGALKILKEFKVLDFKDKKLQRSIFAAHHLRHPGIVPIECAFLQGSDTVVVQTPFFAGGNMRQWCPEKDSKAKLVAAYHIGVAVDYLHTHGVWHRDLKPENIVFASNEPTALPALCDFDLAVDSSKTMTATMQRGTPLYMPRDATPSDKTDIYSLGLTLYALFFCDGDDSRLPQVQSARGPELDLNAVQRQLAATEGDLAVLLRRLITDEPERRPFSGEVVPALAAIVEQMGIEERIVQEQQKRQCQICFDWFDCAQGVECAAGGHFVCTNCFHSYVVMELETIESDDCRLELHRERGGRLCCPARAFTPSCDREYIDSSLARALPDELFTQYRMLQDAALEHRIWEEAQQRLQAEVKRLAQQQRLDQHAAENDPRLLADAIRRHVPNARQCGHCGYGPIEHTNCPDLQAHHREWRGSSRVSNACPRCSWFNCDIRGWPRWDGRIWD